MKSAVEYNEFPRKLFASVNFRKRRTIFLHLNIYYLKKVSADNLHFSNVYL